jgi:hypothetical protein
MNRIQHIAPTILLSLGILMLTAFALGCGATVALRGYDVVMDEPYTGSLYMSMIDGTGSAKVLGDIRGTKGSGVAVWQYGGSERRGGKFTFQLEDGRMIKGDWITETMTTGSGLGFDQHGKPYTLVFGYKKEDEEAWIIKQRASREQLLNGASPRPTLGAN